jgi:tRNA (guanine37-N1)-methyltransferase
MRIDVLTLFPEAFANTMGGSIIGRARKQGIVKIVLTDIREFARDRYGSVDDKPYGGGAGMVMMCQPIFDAVEAVSGKDDVEPKIILLTPQGRTFSHEIAWEISKEKRLMMIAGHYEGFDERIRTGLKPMELSIGDYVLSGGELPAMVVIDAVVRLLPGALGNEKSGSEESFTDGLLEYPQYTRPANFRGMHVPDVLLSGDHKEIEKWRKKQAEERTETRRADMKKKRR